MCDKTFRPEIPRNVEMAISKTNRAGNHDKQQSFGPQKIILETEKSLVDEAFHVHHAR